MRPVQYARPRRQNPQGARSDGDQRSRLILLRWRLRSMTKLPVSLQSLLVQCAAVLLAALLNFLLIHLFAYSPAPGQLALPPGQFALPLWQLALVQGVFAAMLSRAAHQPAWWPPLHAVFLPGVVLAQTAHLPAAVYLAAFVLLLLFYWSSFRTRVPLYLSDSRAWSALPPLLPQSGDFRFIDLGSGLGGVPLYLETRCPRGRFYGTEIAPAPWLISRLRAWFRRSRVRFLRRDYSTLDLAEFDVVFAFLSPAAMPALWRQTAAQMRPGSVFISLSFPVDGRQPDRVITLATGRRHTLYVWRM
jgi:hypothetical protein